MTKQYFKVQVVGTRGKNYGTLELSTNNECGVFSKIFTYFEERHYSFNIHHLFVWLVSGAGSPHYRLISLHFCWRTIKQMYVMLKNTTILDFFFFTMFLSLYIENGRPP